MESLKQRFYEKYALTNVKTTRDFINRIDWNDRLLGIKGSRGVGKTTLLLQYIKNNYKPDNKVLYVSLDNFWFAENRLYYLADIFYKKGGRFLAVDEVHRYPDWSMELKNIYDDFPDLKIAFTGSSMLHLHTANADLSRRAVMYEMKGLSYREFLYFETGIKFPVFNIDEIFKNHITIAADIVKKIKPLEYFNDYLKYGYYPFYLENKNTFHQKLYAAIQTVLEVDIPQFVNIRTSNIIYLKKLLNIISNSVPFKPNLSSVSQRTGIALNTLKKYIKFLKETELIDLLYFPDKGLNSINKAEKIYLNNSNLIFTLSENTYDTGNIRETFFMNQVSSQNTVNATKNADFIINEKYTAEIGGKNKQQKQIKNTKNAFVIKDNIQIGNDNIIPLWIFGFLY